MYKTHLVIGVFFILLLLPHVEHQLLFISVVLISSLLPDIDSVNSKIGSKKVMRIIQIFTKHRGIFHSFTFCILVSIILAMVYPPLALGFFVGFSSHLFFDSFTIEGIRPFWPMKKEIQGKVTTDGRIERGIFYGFAIASGLLLARLAIIYLK
jgi:membrane-bound metal-dependent hydrolase YbcI (DUF457 family)